MAQELESVVDIVWVKIVVAEGEEESASCGTHHIVGNNLSILPRHITDVLKDGIPSLLREKKVRLVKQYQTLLLLS